MDRHQPGGSHGRSRTTASPGRPWAALASPPDASPAGDRDGLRTGVWTTAGMLERHAAGIDDLLTDTEAPVTARRGWWEAWLKSFPDAVPWVVARTDSSGNLRALAPLARRRKLGRMELVGLGDGVSDYLRLPARSTRDAVELASSIAAHLLEVRGPWVLALRQLPTDDPVAHALVTRLPHAALRGGGSAPRTRIDSRDDSHYLSRNYRKAARNRFSRLERAGHEPRIEILRDPVEVQGKLDEIIRICRAREREMSGRSHLDDPRRERFLRTAAVSLAGEGSLEVALLLADERIIAYQLNLLDGRTYRTWNGHHDPTWADYSPGHVLDHRVIRRVLDDETIDEFDWMMGTEAYKLRASTHTVASCELVASSSRAAAVIAVGPRQAQARLVAMARESDRGARVLERLRGIRGSLYEFRDR